MPRYYPLQGLSVAVKGNSNRTSSSLYSPKNQKVSLFQRLGQKRQEFRKSHVGFLYKAADEFLTELRITY